MLRPTAPTARPRQPLGENASPGIGLTSGNVGPPSDDPGRHSHRDCRSPLTLIVARQVGEIVTQYTLIDGSLSEVICKYFSKTKDEGFVRWKTKKFRTFVHHISDEMYLIKKMELVHAIKKLPSEVRSTVHKLNMIRAQAQHD